MRRLTVLYDASCGFCVRCRAWMAEQPAYLEIEFLHAGSPEAARRFPGVDRDDLAVVDDEGGIYRGSDAFILCLWALREYRELSLDLAGPALKPLARVVFATVSSGRRWISRLLGMKSEEAMLAGLAEEPGGT
jgi:predicted DCC family thiol-disulfide oxidoreductase YuxK